MHRICPYLETPVVCEYVVEEIELIPGHIHLVHLNINVPLPPHLLDVKRINCEHYVRLLIGWFVLVGLPVIISYKGKEVLPLIKEY